MEHRKEGIFALVVILLSCISVNFGENVSEKIINESIQNIQNKTSSIFKEIKAIKYDYKLYDKTKDFEVYRTTTNFDVHIVSTHKDSLISLAYRPNCFIIYDVVYLDVFNKNSENMTLFVYVNNESTFMYNFNDSYVKFKFDFDDSVNNVRFKIICNNETLFDTGRLTIIHQNYVDWYEEQKKEAISVDFGELILSKIWYMLTGGGLVLVLCVLIARREKKRKEKEILVGWW